MFHMVLADILDGPTDLGGRPQHVREVAVGENRAVTVHDAVEPLGDANAESLHAAREAPLILGLDDQVDVIALHRKVGDSHPEAIAGRPEGLLDALEAATGTQIPDLPMHAPIDVDRQPAQTRSWEVLDAGLFTLRLA